MAKYQNTLDYYASGSGSIQKPPFQHPLPYTATFIRVGYRYPLWATNGPYANNTLGARVEGFDTYCTPAAYAACYERFFNKVKSQSNWAETLATWRETYDLAALAFEACHSPLKGMADAYKRAKKDWKSPVKQVNDAYLSFVYGVKPLAGDLQATCDLLQKKINPIYVHTKATSRADESWHDNGYYKQLKKKATCEMGAYVEVVNPNLAMFSALGLTNPLALAWDLVPFSFVFDWFYDVGTWLHGLDSLFGLNLIDPYYTKTLRYEFFREVKADEGWGAAGCEGDAVHMVRTVGGLPSPPPYVNLNLSRWRVVHGLSLLLGLATSRN